MPLPLRFDHLFRISPMPSVVLLPNTEFTIIAANNILLEIFNSSEEEILGKGIFEAIARSFPDVHKDQALQNITTLKNSLKQVMATKKPHKVLHQKHLLPISGSSEYTTKYIDVLSIPVLDDQNMITHILHSVEDVTERRTLEKASENEKQRFLDLYEESPCAMAVLKGPDHIYEMVNPLLIKLAGKDDIIGKPIKEVLPELEEQGFLKSLDEVYKTGQTYTANEAFVKLDPKEREEPVNKYLNFTYQPYRNENGEVHGILFFAVDVTEQVTSRKRIEESEKESKRREEKLKQSEKRLKEAQEIAHLGSWEFNIASQEANFSDELCRIYGLPPHENKQHVSNWLNFIHPEDIEGILSEFKIAEETLEERSYNHRIVLKNGSVRHIFAKAKCIVDEDGNLTGTYGIAHDITEAKKAEEKLVQSEKRLKEAQDIAQMGSWSLDIAAEEVKFSDELCRIYGLEPKDNFHTLSEWLAFVHPEDLKEIMENWEEFQQQTVYNQRIITKDGSVKYVQGKSRIEFDEQGEPKKVFGIVQDVTESKRGEEKLKQSENRLKEAQKIAQFGSWEFDFATQEQIFSEEACRIYGLPVEENRHSTEFWLSFIHPDELEEVKSIMKRSEINLEESVYNHRIILKDGIIKHLFAKVKFEFDEQGKPKGVFGIVQDVTENKIAEEKLKQSENKLKEAQEIANLGSWEVDFATGVSLWSDEACRIYGVPLEENNTQTLESWASFIHPEDKEDVMANLEESQRTLTDSDMNNRVILKDGTVKYIYSKYRFERDPHGRPIAMVGAVQDVTEMKIAERNLEQQNKELLKANKELDRFVYSASHDLRSPLASILGLISFIEEDSREEETLEHVKMIKTSVNRLDAFIRNILSYSQNNRTDLEVERIPLKEKIEEIVDSLRTMDRAKGIDFELHITEGHHFYSDTRRFNAIMENLISNAVKYHNENKSGRFVKVTAISDEEKLKLVIIDNGIGISLAHQDKIFDMFFRISGKSNGSGIGLYIVKETVEKLKGSIEVESIEGVGTTFTINLKNGRVNAA